MPISIPIRISTDTRPAPPRVAFRPSSLHIAARLAQHIEQTREKRQPERVYASQITECARKLVLELLGYEGRSIQRAEWVIASDLGTWLHTRIESWLRAIGGVIHTELPLYSEDGAVSGRLDALITHPKSDFIAWVDIAESAYILDVKTVSDKLYKAGINSTNVPRYVAQISVYGRLLNVHKGIILLVNRNTGEMVDWEFDIDFDYADALLARATKIMEFVKTRTIPPAEAWGSTPEGSSYCRTFCPFYDHCAVQQKENKR